MPDANSVHLPTYRAGPENRKELRKPIEEQLDARVIEKAQTKWASHALLAPKMDGKISLLPIPHRCNHL